MVTEAMANRHIEIKEIKIISAEVDSTQKACCAFAGVALWQYFR